MYWFFSWYQKSFWWHLFSEVIWWSRMRKRKMNWCSFSLWSPQLQKIVTCEWSWWRSETGSVSWQLQRVPQELGAEEVGTVWTELGCSPGPPAPRCEWGFCLPKISFCVKLSWLQTSSVPSSQKVVNETSVRGISKVLAPHLWLSKPVLYLLFHSFAMSSSIFGGSGALTSFLDCQMSVAAVAR